MGLQELDISSFNGQCFRDWLSPILMPVVILVRSGNFNRAKCQTALQLLEEVSQKPEFRDDVMFLHFDADECSDFCRTLSVARFPTITVYRNGREIVRFPNDVSVGTIIQRLHIITDPARNHPRAEQPSVVRGINDG